MEFYFVYRDSQFYFWLQLQVSEQGLGTYLYLRFLLVLPNGHSEEQGP